MEAASKSKTPDDAELKALRTQCIRLVEAKDFERFRQLHERVAKEGNKERLDLIASYEALMALEKLAQDNALDDRFRPKMYWMLGPYPGNFGDILTPYILWHAFGVAPRWVAAANADGLCIGSIIKLARSGTRVWGSGTPRSTDPLAREAVYAAVRGPMTRQVVLASGGSCPEVYGDAAVLLPELFDPAIKQNVEVGIIPHVLQDEMVQHGVAKSGVSNVKVISLKCSGFDGIERVIRDIKCCRKIVSSSLHGLIIAHAYGIPAQSMKLIDNGVADDSFKTKDYKASVGLDDRPISVPTDFTKLDWLDRIEPALPPRPIDTETLKAAFPFPRRK